MSVRNLLRLFCFLSMISVLFFTFGCGGGSDAVAVNDQGGDEEYEEEYEGEEYEEDDGGYEDEGYEDEDYGEEDYEDEMSEDEYEDDDYAGEDYEDEMSEEEYEDDDYAGEDYEDEMSEEEYEDDDYAGEDYEDEMSEDEYEDDDYAGEDYEDEMYEEEYEEDGNEDETYDEDGGYGQPAAKQPETLLDWAIRSYSQGRDGEAQQYLAAHALTCSPEESKVFLNKMGWSTPLSKCVMSIRCGIGVVGHAPANFSGSAYPVGTTQTMSQGRSRGGRGEGGYGEGGDEDYGGGYDEGSGGGRSGGGAASLDDFTGELGQKLVGGIRERISRGDYGLVLVDVPATSAGSNQGGGGNDEYDEDGGYGEDEYEDDDSYSGGYGNSGGHDSQPAPALGGADAPTPLLPGFALFPIGQDSSSKDLVAKAKAQGLDMLIVFDITVSAKNPRTGLVTNKTKIEVYEVATGKRDFTTKEINNVAVQVARSGGDTKLDNVDREMENLFEYLDENWRMINPPAESVAGRMQTIGQIFNDPPQNPLMLMAELKSYYGKDMLTGANLLTAFQRLVGEQTAQVLATGDEAAKKAAIDRWVPADGRLKAAEATEGPAAPPAAEATPAPAYGS